MLINCVVYQNGTKLADIPASEIGDYISRPDAFVWVALQDATPAELEEMQKEFGLHELAVEDARHGHQRPKIEEYGASLFSVLHLVEPVSDQSKELNVGELDVFAGSNYVLSVRNRSKKGFLGVRQRCEGEPELLRNGSGFVLYALMDAVVDRYFPILDGFETELESIEKDIFTKGAARLNIERLYELKGRVMVLKHAVAPLQEGASKLHGGRVPPWLATRMATLGTAIAESVIHHYGRAAFLSRLSDPFWFQAFGTVMGMDWHSSGITTSVMGALKRGLNVPMGMTTH